jgi:hypothetical protein
MQIIRLDPGRKVMCDDCGKDYTDLPDVGGLLFSSKACCPECAPRWEELAQQYDEEHAIRARCPKGMSFADWVRNVLRAPRSA